MSDVDEKRERAKDYIPVSLIEKVCPACAKHLRAKGWKGIKLSWLMQNADKIRSNTIGEATLKGLCDYVGEEDPGFFTACMETDFGSFEPSLHSKEGFCAWLHHVCFGRWPAED